MKNKDKIVVKKPIAGVQNIVVLTLCVIFAGSFYSCKEKAGNEMQMFCVCGGCEDKFYYYVQDERVFYYEAILNDWLHIGFYPEVQDAEIVEFIDQTNLFKTFDVRTIDRLSEEILEYTPLERNYAKSYVNTKMQKTCTQLKDIISTLEKSPIVAYANHAMWWGDFYGMVTFSPYFYVAVKDKDDLSDLYAVSQETNTSIVKQPTFDSFWVFTLIANKDSKGNAQQMANYFYETGKFEYTFADWYYIYPVLSNQ